ncbi:hypothetical protein LOAG_02654 [Loa loa]|uniref:Uncharacterized protein n=1 Tax=Loa loa TaxID=7209 RepID=A0A1I7VMH9_LOALO|nr:hypothetical protein LOAG_02654 [Loa loa]EFO25826.1 hypothetical protein LOAG_02654 [Loa loa]
MLGTARGVSLRLGKINLAALDSGLHSRDGYLKARRKREKGRHKITTKNYVHIEVRLSYTPAWDIFPTHPKPIIPSMTIYIHTHIPFTSQRFEHIGLPCLSHYEN